MRRAWSSWSGEHKHVCVNTTPPPPDECCCGSSEIWHVRLKTTWPPFYSLIKFASSLLQSISSWCSNNHKARETPLPPPPATPNPPKTITSFEFSCSHSSSHPPSLGSLQLLSSPTDFPSPSPFSLLAACSRILKSPVCPHPQVHLLPSDVCISSSPPSGLVYQ